MFISAVEVQMMCTTEQQQSDDVLMSRNQSRQVSIF